MLRRILTVLAVSLAAAAPQVSEAAVQKKVALVVGNGAYENAPQLANPVTDAKAIAAAFERLGFITVTGFDLDKSSLERTIREFAIESRDADLSSFFYAGHGIAYNDKNFIVPVDARFADATALDFEAVEMDFVVKQMRYNDGVSLVFIDACRDNPLANTLSRSLGFSTRSAVSRGLAGMDVRNAGKGLAIAFATSPGEVAYDGTEEHSPFTTALLSHIEKAGADITEVMSLVTGDVLRATDERQRPWLNASLTGPVVLKPIAPVAATEARVETASLDLSAISGVAATDASPAPATADLSAQSELFTFAHKSGEVHHYQAYLDRFPNGIFAGIAREEIARAKPSDDAEETKVAALTPVEANRTLVLSDADDAVASIPADDEADAETADADWSDAEEPSPHGVTEAMKAEEGTEETEQALGLDRSERREVQARLNLTEANVGGADGVFGPMTREGITFWQGTHDLPQTGFLTAGQVAVLRSETAKPYAAYVEEQKEIAAAAAARRAEVARAEAARAKASATRSYSKKSTAKKAAPRRTTTASRSTKQRVVRRTQTTHRTYHKPSYHSSGAGNAAAAALVGGLVGGLIGGAIGH